MHTASVIGYFRVLGMCLAVILGVGAFGEFAYAVAVTTCPGGTCSLQELFNGSTITINSTVFRDWQELDTQSAIAGLPDYGAIDVMPIDIPFNPGLRFEANGQWSILDGLALDTMRSEFSYLVESPPAFVGHSLQLLSYTFGGSNTGGSIDVFEIGCGDVNCLDTASVKEVFADNAANTVGLSDVQTFTHRPQFFVFNTITVINDADGETVELHTFEQRLAQVPEPGTLMLLGLGCVGLLSYGWRRRPQQT